LGDVASLKETGALKNGHLLSDIYDEIAMAYGGIATNNELVERNPALVKRFLKATLMGMAYTREFEDETIDIVAGYSEGASRTALAVDYAGVVGGMTEHGAVSRAIQARETEVRAELVGVPQHELRALDEIFDYSFVAEAHAELQESGWKPEK
jgi:ABC-type nitrate/sulfonate/bicarbonate transport system substrate-binding protein